MKIGIIESNASIAAGGAESSMAAFCDFLIKSGTKVSLICEKRGLYSFEELQCDDELRLNLQPLRVQGLVGYIKSVIALISFTKKKRIDILLTHTIHAFPIIRLAKIFTGCKAIVYFKWVYNGSSIGLLNKWGLRGIDRTIYINKYVESYWSKFGKRLDETFLIPDGVKARATISDYKNDTAKRLLYVGRIYEGKGLHLLVEALLYLDNDYYIDVVGFYDITGSHPNSVYHKYLHNLLLENNLSERVTFHGYLTDFEHLYKAAGLIVVPSTAPDAQPLVILEAIARKKLVIGTRVGGIPEILKNDLEELLSDPKAESLAEKIKAVNNWKSSKKREVENKLFQKFNEEYEITQTHNNLEKAICRL